MTRWLLTIGLMACGGSATETSDDTGTTDVSVTDSGLVDTGTPDTGTPTVDTGTPTSTLEPWTPLPTELELALSANLGAAHTASGAPGVALAVSQARTRQRWIETQGLASLEGEVPWELSTPYPIGSVSKMFTTAMVLQLMEEGELSLDDPLESWLSTSWDGEGVTVRHLLQHTSGITSYNYVGSFDSSAEYTPQELVDWAALHGPDLVFPPGSQWEYSNTNFVLLGQIVEVATGRTFEEELQDRLLTPLGMFDTFMATDFPEGLVRGYEGDPLEDVTADGHPTLGWAAGGMVSTPADMSSWGSALFAGEVVSEGTLELMMTPLIIDGVDVGYGLGLFGGLDPDYGNYWGHSGGIGGHLSHVYHLEAPDTVVVAMVNSFEADVFEVAQAAWLAVLDIE